MDFERTMNRRRYSIDFASHMAACDANYERLMLLAPSIRTDGSHDLHVQVGAAVSTVRLHVIERCPYTTTVRLTQLLLDHDLLPAPSLTVRLYHDAATAEVTEYQNQRAFLAVYVYPNDRMRQPDEKAQVNQLLGELLDYCRDHGVKPERLAVS